MIICNRKQLCRNPPRISKSFSIRSIYLFLEKFKQSSRDRNDFRYICHNPNECARYYILKTYQSTYHKAETTSMKVKNERRSYHMSASEEKRPRNGDWVPPIQKSVWVKERVCSRVVYEVPKDISTSSAHRSFSHPFSVKRERSYFLLSSPFSAHCFLSLPSLYILK